MRFKREDAQSCMTLKEAEYRLGTNRNTKEFRKLCDCESRSLADNASCVDTEHHPRPLDCNSFTRDRYRHGCSAAGGGGGPAELETALVAVDAMRGGAEADHGHH
jgi:hypothetical protein